MYKLFRPFSLIALLLGVFSLAAQIDKPIRAKHSFPMVYCPGSDEVSHHYTPAQKRSRTKKTDTEITVTYLNGVPNNARTAFETGVVSILKDLFDTPIPINISISWERLDEGALAGAMPGASYSNFPNSPFPQHVYPVALAEKISRRNLNPIDDFDIIITVNSAVEWYYQFNNPGGIGNRFDFVTVLLHEVLHGLGFTASVGVNEATPPLGFVRVWTNNAISIFTDFLYTGIANPGTKLTVNQDGTSAMTTALTSNSLFFNLISKNERAKLYAPGTFDPGSSVSHMDESTYNNTNSALMTPFSNRGDIELDPGLGLDLMYDIGWDMTYLLHTTLPGSEELDKSVVLEMQLITDSPIDSSTLKIHYSSDEFITEDITADLIFNQNKGLYEFVIPAPNREVKYSYYFTATNRRNIKFTNPGIAPNNVFTYEYGLDRERPRLNHERVANINTDNSKIDIVAEIIDEFTGVASAVVNWSIDGQTMPSVNMERQLGFQVTDTTDNYKAILTFPNGPLSAGTVVRYQIVAVDKAKSANSSQLPFTGFYSLTVEQVKEAVITYVNNFNVASNDFAGNGFRINRPTGFADNAIHSDHPYLEAGEGNFRNFIYELQIPITIRDKDQLIDFDEIVIVEPGEPGARFGDDEFWDYVIVEGKIQGTDEWLPFLDGYDCNAASIWRTAFDNQSSGTPSMFRKRVINMVTNGNFKAGDVVFVRFRLFSDPFVFGWGWAIDNLKIQDVSTAVEDFVIENRYNIYPNPNNTGNLNIDIDLKNQSTDLQVEIFDVYGRRVKNERLSVVGSALRHRSDISDLTDGMYIVNVRFVTGDHISQKLVIQRF